MGFAQGREGREVAASLRVCRGLTSNVPPRQEGRVCKRRRGDEGDLNRCSTVTLSSQRVTVPGQLAMLPPHRCYSPKKKQNKKRGAVRRVSTARPHSLHQAVGVAQARSPSCSLSCYRGCEPPSPLAYRSQERRALWDVLCAHGPSPAWNLPTSALLLDPAVGRDETCPRKKLWPKHKAF